MYTTWCAVLILRLVQLPSLVHTADAGGFFLLWCIIFITASCVEASAAVKHMKNRKINLLLSIGRVGLLNLYLLTTKRDDILTLSIGECRPVIAA